MTKKLLIPSAACILSVALLLILISPKHRDGTNSSGASTESSSATSSAGIPNSNEPRTKLEREDQETVKARRELEKELDELLPAQFPEQHSALCDVTLEPGESVLLGGFKRSDGNSEFTMISVEAINSGEFKGQFKTKAKTMVLSPERSSELGFDTLVSPAKTRIQKSLIVDSGSITGAGNFVDFMSSPSISALANTPATMSIGNSESAYVISTLVNPMKDGDSIRLRARIESPGGLP